MFKFHLLKFVINIIIFSLFISKPSMQEQAAIQITYIQLRYAKHVELRMLSHFLTTHAIQIS